MNIRKSLYYGAHRMIGRSLGTVYEQYCDEDDAGVPADTAPQALIRLFDHCAAHVPYYAAQMATVGLDYHADPFAYLQRLPLLNKTLIRQHFEELQSDDLAQRRWQYNTSGGSTGTPVRFIQDADFIDRQMAMQMLSYRWAGRAFGDSAVFIWGSERDVLQGSIGWKRKTLNALTNEQLLNAFRMTPATMRAFLARVNSQKPHLIVAYAQAIFELALFAEKEGIAIAPQKAILTSACTLYPFMRAQIERIFGCKVFDRYGSREVGDIACECSAHHGLHVFPWGNYVEVLDDAGNPAPAGVEGNIVVTNLTNYAMPLIRYAIGDRGTLSPHTSCACGRRGQMIERVAGRNVDSFKTKEGVVIDGEYFTHLLYFRDWVDRFQVVQTDHSAIVFKIVPSGGDATERELAGIVRDTKALMGADCRVDFQFMAEIPPTVSGKYRYTISEVM
jgi:phenylacetate-CoA ligase